MVTYPFVQKSQRIWGGRVFSALQCSREQDEVMGYSWGGVFKREFVVLIIILLLLMSFKDDSLLSNLCNLINDYAQKHVEDVELLDHSDAHYDPSRYDHPLDELLEQRFNLEKQNSDNQQGQRICQGWTFDGEIPDGTSVILSELGDFENPFVPGKNYPEEKEEKEHQEEKIKEIKCVEVLRSEEFLEEIDSESQQPIGVLPKNQTKNIPKNFGKAIISFISKYRQDIQPILEQHEVSYQQFHGELLRVKKQINTIANLRNLWMDFKYSECMRMISNRFLRRHSLHYIFNSRISNFTTHIKYRKRLQEAVLNPQEFRHIKQY